ncbi:MAG: hypothetical protein HY769_09825 [Candidatus Stahlbacteria bacterium]|nr:hypothetical protein [Candidatus Stahlbacteria bacterium]
MLTDIEIKRLIEIEKQIVEPPKEKMTIRQGHLRNDFKLKSIGDKEKFTVYIRVLGQFNEDFSVGMNYIDSEGKSICLIRYNGNHGIHKNHREGESPFDGCHIHITTEEAISSGESPEHFAEETRDYATWHEALMCFLKRTNITNSQDYFPEIYQPRLFDKL